MEWLRGGLELGKHVLPEWTRGGLRPGFRCGRPVQRARNPSLTAMLSTEIATIDVRVARAETDSHRVRILVLERADGAPLPDYAAGAHVDVHAAGLIRQYSLCSLADPSRYEIAVLLDQNSRGGSSFMHELAVGDIVQISSPRNLFPLNLEAEHSILVAGGIGITPLLAMAETLARENRSFELHYCARSASAAPFLSRLATVAWKEHVHLHFDDGPPSQCFMAGQLLGRPVAGHHLYVCGPVGLMNAVLSTARTAGWPEPALHWEAFGAAAAGLDSDQSFEVEIESTGAIITVGRDECVTDALDRHGIVIEVSCGQGICGACLTRVVSGIPDHNDYILTSEERSRYFTPCCSRSLSKRLVLGL